MIYLKKIDLHIHTSPSSYERNFNFSLDKLKEYVDKTQLDIIAITNHNHFNKEQFLLISSNLNCSVYPGVEVDLESSHILVIFPKNKIDELEIASDTLERKITSENDSITFDEFTNIFPNFKDYILIPHIKKDPAMKTTTLEKFDGIIKTGEVKSAKKFEVAKKDSNCLVPVFFSDIRAEDILENFPTKYTYVDIVADEYGILKNALCDKTKVFISSNKNNEEFAFLPDGTLASTKLNVIMGKRSSGKTYNLKQINNSGDSNNVKFITQFSLTGKSEEEKFKELTEKEQENVINDYLKPLRKLVDTILEIDETADTELENYITTLKEHATNQYLQDSYSKAKLFNETEFSFLDNLDTKRVINAITIILDSKHNAEIIEKYLSKSSLISLLKELIKKRKNEYLEYMLKKETDKIVKVIKRKLNSKSSMISISEVDFYKVYKNKALKDNFNYIINKLKIEKSIYNLDIYRFTLIINKKPFENVQELKSKLKTNIALSDTFKAYNQPYNYIRQLANLEIPKSNIYKALLDFDIKVINEKGNELSGGERAEYNLLREIKGAEQYDILLLDEPEASFDNPFIKDYIIDIIKNISQKTTVFITTHNNSLGILIRPNKLIYTSNDEDGFKVYTGEFGSKNLTTVNGDSIISYQTILNVMEAGEQAYKERSQIYESFKN